VLRNVDAGKWVIGGLPARKPIGLAFVITRGEGDKPTAIRTGLIPGLEDGCCNCTILTGKDVRSMSLHKTKTKTTAYIQVLQKVMKSHQKYPKFLTTMAKMATTWTYFKW